MRRSARSPRAIAAGCVPVLLLTLSCAGPDREPPVATPPAESTTPAGEAPSVAESASAEPSVIEHGTPRPGGSVGQKSRKDQHASVSVPGTPVPRVMGTPLLGPGATWQAEGGDAWREGEARGPWRLLFTGYGVVSGSPSGIVLEPRAAARLDRTHGALVTTEQEYDAFTLRTRLTTTAQLRTTHRPNPWEVGWLLWAFTDTDHFYALALKPNGWELSKQDPAYPGKQRFLASGTSPATAVGTSREVVVRYRSGTSTVWVGGRPLVHVTDHERPYGRGAAGLYTEDARVLVNQFVIRDEAPISER